MNKIDASYFLSNQETKRAPSSELGKDEFLKILMTQLQNQDPLNPMQDTDFIAQMAQFSSLEQMMNMATSIDTLVHNQLVSPVVQYSHMIGKHVSYQSYDEETGKETGMKSGKVVAVSQKDGWAILEMENGDKVYADSIIEVSDTAMTDDEKAETEEPKEPEPDVEGSE